MVHSWPSTWKSCCKNLSYLANLYLRAFCRRILLHRDHHHRDHLPAAEYWFGAATNGPYSGAEPETIEPRT